MKLPPLKGVLIHISYWSCVAMFTIISTAIGITVYVLDSILYTVFPHIVSAETILF